MITIRKSEDRGHFNHGWLDTYHTFSFANYYDPEWMGYRSLRVINDDLVMPGMDGINVIKELQSDPGSAAIPTLALTASAMPEDKYRALSAGVTCYMTKPVSLSVLRREVSRLIAGPIA